MKCESTHQSPQERPFHPGLMAAILLLGFIFCESASGDIYVYEMQNGARLITDKPLKDGYTRLIRKSTDPRGAGKLAANINDPSLRVESSAYDKLIQRLADQYDVDFALVKAIMHVESSFNPYAASHRGALGLMQVMPATAKRYGVHDMYNPTENIRAGILHIKYLSEMFDHKSYLVIAAYNAGENAVRRNQGIPPYEETQNYVRKVLYFKRRYAAPY